MDTHVPVSFRMMSLCLFQLFLLLTARPWLTDAQCMPGDTEGPTLTCVSSIELPASLPNTFFGISSPAHFTATDPSGLDSTTTTNITLGTPTAGGSLFPPGITPLGLTVMDNCGNPSTCTILIINTLTELPVNNCPDFSTTTDTDAGEATFTFTPPSYGPNDVITEGTYFYHGGGIQPDVVFATTNPPALPGPPFQLPVGTNVITTTISDAVLDFTCSSTIVVEDNVSPNISCPDSFTSNELVVNFTAVASDIVDPSPVVTYSPLGPRDTFPLGQTNITATATDNSTNSKSCTFTVTVVDNVAPNITCPADIDSTTLTVSFSTIVTDDIDPAPTVTYDPWGPGSVFPLGPTTVNVTAMDSSSNSQSCSFTVTVEVPLCV